MKNYFKAGIYFALFEFTFWTTISPLSNFIKDLIFKQMYWFDINVIINLGGMIIAILFFGGFIKATALCVKEVLKK